jgi:predicted Fe-Mo cluster-binding NifX family protein
MKIAVTSQNFKMVTGHAGKSRRFIIYDIGTPCDNPKVVWLDLPMDMTFHEFSGGPHPLDGVDVILTASAGKGLIDKLARRGVQVVTCGESEPRKAVRDFLMGEVKQANPFAHLEHERHACVCA